MFLTYKDHKIILQEGQSVLEALLETGESISYACKQGVCQSCVLKTVSGQVPTASQVGLKPTQKEQGYFLSCLCKPEGDLEVVDCDDLGFKVPTSVVSLEKLTPSIYKVRLKIEGDFAYKAGQYINLIRPSDQLTRSYSLASVQAFDTEEIELHVKVFPGGEMSNWLMSLSEKDSVEIMGPMGDCFYLPSFKDKNLLLLGYGTGLAPLYGILKDALTQGHTGDIHLYHWGNTPEDLYYQAEIDSIVSKNAPVFYKTGLEALEKDSLEAAPHLSGEACVVIQKDLTDLKDWKIFLCGGEAKVNKARRIFYLAGADLSDIYADAFFTWQKPQVGAEKVS